MGISNNKYDRILFYEPLYLQYALVRKIKTNKGFRVKFSLYSIIVSEMEYNRDSKILNSSNIRAGMAILSL